MRFPYPVLALDDAGQQQWARYFASGTGGRDRDVEESIWRRTQHPLNAAQSGWDGTGGRRRIVHYRNRYAVAGTHLVLTDWYLYYCLTCPAAEARRYAAQVADWARAGGWACEGGGESWRLGTCALPSPGTPPIPRTPPPTPVPGPGSSRSRWHCPATGCGSRPAPRACPGKSSPAGYASPPAAVTSSSRPHSDRSLTTCRAR